MGYYTREFRADRPVEVLNINSAQTFVIVEETDPGHCGDGFKIPHDEHDLATLVTE